MGEEVVKKRSKVYIENAEEVFKIFDKIKFLSTQKLCKNFLNISVITYRKWRLEGKVPAKYKETLEGAFNKLEAYATTRSFRIQINRPKLKLNAPMEESVDAWLLKKLEKGPRLLVNLVRAGKFSRIELHLAAHRIGVRSKVTGFGKERRATWSIDT